MARPLRWQVPGAWCHITSRGNERKPIFRDDESRRKFLRLLAEFPVRFGIEIHAFVLMENHYHLLMRPSLTNLSQAMGWLNVSYSIWFNWQYRRSGHLFQGRYRSEIIENVDGVARVARYLHLNPVRISKLNLGKVEQSRLKAPNTEPLDSVTLEKRLTLLASYPWSSWAVYSGKENRPEWLETRAIESSLGNIPKDKLRKALREYTELPLRQGIPENPWDQLIGGLVLGSEEFARTLRKQIPSSHPAAASLDRQSRARPSWETMTKTMETARGKKWLDLVESRGDWSRDGLLYGATKWEGYRLSDLVKKIEGLQYNAAAQGVRRFSRRFDQDPAFQKEFRTLWEKISVS